MAQWQYKTLLVEFQKDGLLGEKYIDEDETEAVLNEEGRRGWELVTASLTPEGMMFFCKKELPPGSQQAETAEDEPETVEAEEAPDDGALGSIRIF
ncbi:DUF4177 domain-containing protein [Candidatus Electronema sp. TJ]|uniref:DUF4177 domain-containing protein n=1 Tax=Candidatus Electronema sp. TJ TaxID=3401573 RepID=UPI003AA90514